MTLVKEWCPSIRTGMLQMITRYRYLLVGRAHDETHTSNRFILQKSIVASQQALERFLTRDLAKEPSEEQKLEQSADSRPEDESEKNERPTNGIPHPQSSVHPPGVTTVNGIVNPDVCDISIGDIVCRHGRLDPNKTDDMKRISLVGLLSPLPFTVAET